jgi:Fe2+ transport system protein FeoA
MSHSLDPVLAPSPELLAPGACSLDQLRGARRPAASSRFRVVGLAGCATPSATQDARRLALLGLRPGAELRVLLPPGPRGAVLGVGTARIALGHDLVRQLQVVAL